MMGPRGWYYVSYVLNGISDQRSTGSSDRAGILNFTDTIQLSQDAKVNEKSKLVTRQRDSQKID